MDESSPPAFPLVLLFVPIHLVCETNQGLLTSSCCPVWEGFLTTGRGHSFIKRSPRRLKSENHRSGLDLQKRHTLDTKLLQHTQTNKHTRLQIWCTWLFSSWSSSQVRICAASILDGVHVFDVWHLDIISGCVWEHGACVCCFVVCCHRATMQSSNPKWSKSKVKAKTSLVCLP